MPLSPPGDVSPFLINHRKLSAGSTSSGSIAVNEVRSVVSNVKTMH